MDIVFDGAIAQMWSAELLTASSELAMSRLKVGPNISP